MSVQKGTDPTEITQGLEDIAQRTMQIAETLRQASDPGDFLTQPYADGETIFDIRQSQSTPDDEVIQE